MKCCSATHCKRCGAQFKPGEPDIQFVKDETGDAGGYFHRPCLKADLRLEILAGYPKHAPGDSGAAAAQMLKADRTADRWMNGRKVIRQ
jgi:hypothetical protein